MKTVVKAMVLPVVAFALASAGALSTSNSAVSKTAKPIITGFIHEPLEESCEEVTVNCNPIEGETCTYNSSGNTLTVYRKFQDDPNRPCNLPLFKDPQS